MSITEHQLQQLRERFDGVEAATLGSGTVLVTVPNVPLPEGWNKAATAVRFLVPPGYPFAALDCFWGDHDLRLADGRVPQNASEGNPVPEANQPGMWFSWHLSGGWNANRDTLSSWMNVILDRLRRVQ